MNAKFEELDQYGAKMKMGTYVTEGTTSNGRNERSKTLRNGNNSKTHLKARRSSV